MSTNRGLKGQLSIAQGKVATRSGDTAPWESPFGGSLRPERATNLTRGNALQNLVAEPGRCPVSNELPFQGAIGPRTGFPRVPFVSFRSLTLPWAMESWPFRPRVVDTMQNAAQHLVHQPYPPPCRRMPIVSIVVKYVPRFPPPSSATNKNDIETLQL